MVTQIKIKKEVYSYDNTVLYKTENIIIPIPFVQSILFKFEESDNLFLAFEFDSTVKSILIESYDDKDIKIVNSNEKFNISKGRYELGSYYAGYFNIQIEVLETTYNAKFLVNPKNLDYAFILSMRSYVNEFYSGLSLDLMRHKHTSSHFDMSSHLPNADERYMFILENFSVIMANVNRYLNIRYEESYKKMMISHSSKKMNADSIKWLAIKGMDKNENINNPDVLLIKKTIFTIDNDVNQFFKKQLLFWNSELTDLMQIIDSYASELNMIVNEKNSYLEQSEVRLNLLDEQKVIASGVMTNSKNQIHRIKKRISDMRELIDNYKTILQSLRHYKAYLESVIYNTWIKNVKVINRTNMKIKDKRLKIFIDIKNEYLNIKIQNSSKREKEKKTMFSEKSSPELFETFNLILIIDMLKDFGFEIEEEFFAFKSNLLYSLSNPSKLNLYRDGWKCEIIYDMELQKSNSDFTESGFCYVNSYHNRPDLLLAFYKDDKIPICSIVIEAKWRPEKNIYNAYEDTEVVVNLKDYYNLCFHNEEGKSTKTIRGVISKVLVAFPSIEEKLVHIQQDEIIAIGMLPSLEIKNSQGYNNLRTEIESVLNNYKVI